MKLAAEPLWLKREAILAIYEELITEHGGVAGIRDEALLDSALAKPQQIYSYTQADVPQLAAAYCLGIIRNHPFMDGNKRTAFVAMLLFLRLNGWQFTAPPAESVSIIIHLAQGSVDEKSFTDWLRKNSKPA